MSENSEGPYFEDFKIGQRFKSKVGRTITDVDNIWFTLLTNNSNQIHFNKDYTEKYFPGEPFKGRLVVNGFLTLAIVAGLLVEQTSQNGFMLGIENVKFLNPVFAGDTIYGEAEVIEVRESKSRPGFGIVKIRTWGYNQRGEKVIEFDRVFMVRKRGVSWTGEKKT
ncbi:MaoC family dehydratase [Saccharolobus caldissimus]|uniref:MaoC family dehydratase n=1 Tax=Saccharolobus caldissimus TaxID=1702097 RepID=A0AAQ4CTJ1_9CREN|nr:MaoC family dehydratase [Saccharolobus caldissimus]BDB99122.1 MaoC family dehydratase [Saccharolobus caldissimus]